MKIIEVNKENFESIVLESQEKILVDFYADWCGPCRMLRPILEEIAEERESIKIASVDIDEQDYLAMKYDISSIPCLIVFKDGKEIARSIGSRPKDEVIKLIEEV